MAEEKENTQGKSGGSGNRKRSRRRYFRRKKNSSGESNKSETSGTKKGSDGGKQQSRSKSQRNRRRRRRSKSRSGNGANSTSMQTLKLDYTPPESVFIYTHVLRPEQRDSYSFRSEISSGTGRTLDDFDIDLSLLFPDESDQGESDQAESTQTESAQTEIVYQAADHAADSSMVGNEPTTDDVDDDQESESATGQQSPDETAQANQFQSEDDIPSSFA